MYNETTDSLHTEDVAASVGFVDGRHRGHVDHDWAAWANPKSGGHRCRCNPEAMVIPVAENDKMHRQLWSIRADLILGGIRIDGKTIGFDDGQWPAALIFQT
jgi:hypothetical protein